jgi:alkanesulfonate monooxygenase SsuD/methylene tetrahydromethanopterin reductase-like flavin-dependent oxidoreductase (luciferase family)
MRIGISLTSHHDVADTREGARWMIERAQAARRAGLDSLFLGDHHNVPKPYYQNVPMLGRLLAEWDDKPAGCLFLLPLWNPVLVAEQVGTLAAIARGRFIFQCGLGTDEAQFLAMGANIKQRPSAFEESFALVKRLLAGETVSSQGRFVVENARVAPRPTEPVEYWIGASARVSIDRAARIADGWLASPGLTIDKAREQAAWYLDGCAKYGRPPAAVAIRRDIYVGESAVEADAVGQALVKAGYRGFDPKALVWGSVEQVTEKFRALKPLGYTDIIVRHLTNDHAKILGSLSRLADVRRQLQNS